jgi:polyferredoxin/Tfp pilus assembly protein PilF
MRVHSRNGVRPIGRSIMPSPLPESPASDTRAAVPRGQTARCGEKREARVKLPVLEVGPDGAAIRRSKSGKRRAVVLLLVHVLILGHVLHWLWAGKTVTPVEPSEAMETLKYGRINAGFLFFAAALVATFVLGRWVCGWGCHLVAYQDLTLWLLKKLRLRPKPFRSRLLLMIPLIAALYMFIWPLAYRLFIGAGPPPLSWHLARTGFWDTFPSYGVAALTILVCGMAIIYFLGPKGFCTYACPYGAFFAPMDKLAVGRIRVTDACRQCGHCSAVCTSNVDVAREVNLYGMVVDPGCMKCLDCVSVCPNDALYFGFGAPAIGRKPRANVAEAAAKFKPPRRDLTVREEWLALALFAVGFFAFRGLYGRVPFLLSLGAAGITTYLMLKALQCFYRPDVLLQKVRLRVEGRLSLAATPFFAAVLPLAAFTLHSVVWRYHDYRGRALSERLPNEAFGWTREADTLAEVGRRDRATIAAAQAHLEAAERWGLISTPEIQAQITWLTLLGGEPARAVERARHDAQRRPDDCLAWVRLANFQTIAARQDPMQRDAARRSFRQALAVDEADRARRPARLAHLTNDTSSFVWTQWAMFLADHGENTAAREAFEKAVGFDPASTLAWLAYGGFQRAHGEIDAARGSLLRAVRCDPDNHLAVRLLEQIARDEQDFAGAASQLSEALEALPSLRVLRFNRAHAYARLGRYDEAVADFRAILRDRPETHHTRADLGAVLLARGDIAGAIVEYEYLAFRRPEDVEVLMKLAFLYEAADRPRDAAARYETVTRIGNDAERQAAREALRRLPGG